MLGFCWVYGCGFWGPISACLGRSAGRYLSVDWVALPRPPSPPSPPFACLLLPVNGAFCFAGLLTSPPPPEFHSPESLLCYKAAKNETLEHMRPNKQQPKPQTLNPQTLNPKPSTPNPKPRTLRLELVSAISWGYSPFYEQSLIGIIAPPIIIPIKDC